MAQVEREKKFSEKIWDYAVWGTVGVIALVAIVNFAGSKIAALEKSLGFGVLR